MVSLASCLGRFLQFAPPVPDLFKGWILAGKKLGVYVFKTPPWCPRVNPGVPLGGLYSLGGPGETCCRSEEPRKLYREGGRGQLKRGVEVVSKALSLVHPTSGLVSLVCSY